MQVELEAELTEWLKSGGECREWIDTALKDGRIESRKQAVRTLEKWTRKGVYNYGVSIELGWLTNMQQTSVNVELQSD